MGKPKATPTKPAKIFPWRPDELALGRLVRTLAAAKDRSPLRILGVIYRLAPADGGPPEMLRQLAANYEALGDLFEVVTLDDPGAEYLRGLRFPVHALGLPSNRFGLSQRLHRWLADNSGRFDFMVMNGIWRFPSVAAWKAAKNADIPYAVFTHGSLDVFFRRRYPLKHAKKMAYWPLQYTILRQAAAVLFTSELERQLALASFQPRRWTSLVLPYGTNPPPTANAEQVDAFEAAAPELAARRFLLFLSRIHPKEGCDLLIEAFAKVATDDPGLDLVVAGPDQVGLQKELRRRASELGIGSRVHWPGMLQGPAKYGAFRRAEAFVLPSHQENFGIVVAEALACGTPVLLSDQVNIWQDVLDSGTGLVEPDTQEGIDRLLARWLALGREERAAMSSRAEPVFRERFSLRRTAEHIHALGEIATGRRSPTD